MRDLRPALLALPLLLAPLAPALAQVMGSQPAPAAGARQQAPAPALPGLAARRTPQPIQGDPTANLSPNAALFDAVNRGDLAAARDAVQRGASLETRNALGLTALDAAVDQGRHEIAFYLLSARDLSRVAPPPEAGRASLDRPPPAPAPRPAPRASQPAAAPAAPRAARLWAGDGGAPRPEIGFLGFDAGRPAGGRRG
jgi:hypothetical protein